MLILLVDLYADESATTGESVPRLKDRDEPMLYCGSVVSNCLRDSIYGFTNYY